MPHMKYFQAIADIERHYEDILYNIDNPSPISGHLLLETWDIDPKDKELLTEEKEVLRYLIGCQLSIVRDTNAKKPSLDVVKRCFERQLHFLEKIHKCHAYNVNKLSYAHAKLIQKQYKACRHYLFKFSLPAWYEKMPNEILTFENKHPDFYKKMQERRQER
ncbi:hypothetical protein CVD28_03415 [Bacillus sp. M6-12]|uniref:hypothetical protein n=1 Tax=Bacillus sp. M6-12 TaxID=2054166 RepID=UPI000C7904C1|nr:hypothetical protein [Bacillus sp. M6-12]PLS19478.1 hypothetical protein CVD28_03415 [Bacillus sp. M6-12]